MASITEGYNRICSKCQKGFLPSGKQSNGHVMVSGSSDKDPKTEEQPEVLFCPDCSKGATIRVRPQLLTATPMEDTVLCTLCIDDRIPAAKACLQCDAFLCHNHLSVHPNSEDHKTVEPTIYFMKRSKCPNHNKVLRYFCCNDAICVCVDCCQIGEHKGHQTETLKEASEKKRQNLKNRLEQLTRISKETEERGHSLRTRWELERGKVANERERVTALFRDLRRHLEDLERRLLHEITQLEEQISRPVSELINQLEIQKNKLGQKMCHIKKMCDAEDPLTVLLDFEPQTSDVSTNIDNAEMDQETDENIFPQIGESIHGFVTVTVHKKLMDIITESTKLKGYHLEEVSDITLDARTSARDLEISLDQKMASWHSVKPLSLRKSMRKKNRQMFECSQVLSTRNFSTGRHYWEVEIGEKKGIRLGVTYAHSIKKGLKSHVGENEKSWCLRIWYGCYSAIYNRQVTLLQQKVECNRLGVFLDYEAGQLSFFELDSTIRHLHTFTATFTEPLYAAFWVYRSWVKVIT